MTDRPSAASSAVGFRKVFGDVAGFATSQYALRFASILRGFVVAKLLGPAGNGLLQHFVIIFEYGQQAHLGVLPGYNKRLGHQLGAGQAAEFRSAQDTGLGGMIAAGVLVWVVFCGYAGARWDQIHPADRIGLPLVGLLVILENVTNTYRALLRSYGRIGPISALSFSFAASSLIISIALIPPLGIHGVLIGWLVARLATSLVFIRQSKERFRPRLDPRVLRTLFLTGLPISAFHITRLMLRNVDRVLIDTVLEKSDLGIYGFAVTLASLVRYGADAVAFVIYPLFLRKYGETRDPRELLPHLREPTAFLAVFVPVVLGFLILTLGVPVRWILPAFSDSVDIFRLLTISVVFSSLAVLPGFFMMAIDRQNWLIPIGLTTVAFTYGVGLWAIRAGHGLLGVAMVTNIGLAVDATAVLLLAARFAFGSLRPAIAWIARVYAAPLYVAAVLALIWWGVPRTALAAWGEGARSVAEGGLFLAVMTPAVWAFERRTRFLARLRETGREPPRGEGGP